MAKIRALSLDGGGTHAGVLARTLGRIYGDETGGRDIIRQFDFVAGNSGGAIVMAALLCNYKPAEVAALYDSPKVLEHMFSPRWFARWPLLRMLPLRYSSTGKLAALKAMLDAKPVDGGRPSEVLLSAWPALVGSDVELLITAFDFDRERAAFFRSNRASAAQRATMPDVTIAEAAHASCNPPILYYDRPAMVGGRRFWDGALAGYDNPVFACVVEALVNRPGREDDIRVLSLGTWAPAMPVAARPGSALERGYGGAGLLASLRKEAAVVLRDPPDVASFHAHVALRQPMPAPGTRVAGNVVRLCPAIHAVWDRQSAQWALPAGFGPDQLAKAIAMDLDVMDRENLDLVAKVVEAWQNDEIPNQPIRAGDHFECDIGHDRFTEAVAHWKAISG